MKLQIGSALGILAAAVAMAPSAGAQPPAIQGIGILPGRTSSRAIALSRDGNSVAGYCGSTPQIASFRWTRAAGLAPLAASSMTRPFGISDNGQVIVGGGEQGVGLTGAAYRWTLAGGAVPLSVPVSQPVATAVSGDGLVVGGSWVYMENTPAWRWSASGASVLPGNPSLPEPTYHQDSVRGISRDGSVIVGAVYDGTPQNLAIAALWHNGGTPTLLGPGAAWAVSPDGSIVVGGSSGGAFRWTQANGPVPLGGNSRSASALSADGHVIVGSTDALTPFIWTQQTGVQDLATALTTYSGVNLAGWTLRSVNGITFGQAGMVLIGDGTNPAGQSEGWILTVPCRADANGNGAIEPLDVATFISRWLFGLENGTLDGDFDGNGAVQPADVAAFVAAWYASLNSGLC